MSGGMPHKKGGHEEGGGHAPAWIVSFADMVILLMSFFVLLLSTSSQKTATDEDLLKILASVKVGFGYMPKPNSKDPIDVAVFQILSQRRRGVSGSGNRWQEAAIDGKVNKERDTWLKAQSPIGRPVTFSKNSTKIPPEAATGLDEVAEIIRHHFRAIVIQAHCSPEEAAEDPSGGHELTFRRAAAVQRALEDRGISATRLRLVSCSQHSAPPKLKGQDRQLVVVTMGSHLLPTDADRMIESSMPSDAKTKMGPHP